MRIVVFGTGFVGSAIVKELLARGNDVIPVSRSSEGGGSVLNAGFVAGVTAGADVIVAALPAAGLADAVAVLVTAAQSSGARLGVVGGASTIPAHDGEAPEGDTDVFPERFAPLHHGHQAAYAVLEAAPPAVDWFSFVPAGQFGSYKPGTKTGHYRTSTSSQVKDAAGRSFIGVEDYAIAFADEVDHPVTHRGWITVGY
ncbi:MAG: NAD-dependent epimerase [Actinomycetota bacterium]